MLRGAFTNVCLALFVCLINSFFICCVCLKSKEVWKNGEEVDDISKISLAYFYA